MNGWMDGWTEFDCTYLLTVSALYTSLFKKKSDTQKVCNRMLNLPLQLLQTIF